jgi:hypothetical protein
MNIKTIRFVIVVLALTAILAAWPARGAAQDVEIGALLGWNFPGIDTTYIHSFVPQFTVKPFTGSGGQQIRVQGISGLGLGAYFNIVMRDHWLLQFSYTPFSTDLQGSSSDYTVSLNYTASKPPDTPPQPFSYTFTSQGWQAIGGTIKDKAYSLSMIYRFGTAETALAADLIAGLTYFHFSGSLQAVGFTRFWLDDVGQLHSEDYSLWLDFGPKDSWGGNVGAALNFHFNSNFGIVFQGRYYLCIPVKTTIGFRMISLEGMNETPIYPNKERIDKNEFKVNGSFLSLQGGFKVMF